MPAFATIALNIALGIANISQIAPSIADAQYGKLLYELRSVNDGRGVGGSPPYCASSTEDAVLIVYTVRNGNDFPVSAQAIPRLVMIDPKNAVLAADRERTEGLSGKLVPYLRVRNGVLGPGEQVVLADVFVTPRNSVRDFPWKFRIQPNITLAVKLPQAKRADPPECV